MAASNPGHSLTPEAQLHLDAGGRVWDLWCVTCPTCGYAVLMAPDEGRAGKTVACGYCAAKAAKEQPNAR